MEPDGAEETNEDDRPAGLVAIAGRLSGVSRADMAQDMVFKRIQAYSTGMPRARGTRNTKLAQQVAAAKRRFMTLAVAQCRLCGYW